MTTADVLTEARGWVQDCEGEDTELLTDSQVRAYITRQYDGGWPAFLANSAPDDVTDVARAWLESNPLLAVDPDGDTITIWTAITTHFTDGWDGFAAHYARLCVCGDPADSTEHTPDGHPFRARDLSEVRS